MANKLQNINDLAMETTLQITNNPDDWMNFLNTAANNYKYSFNDQVLIFAQKPEATACADMNTWNTRVHRWIKKGSRGIALVQNNGYGNSLRHVFDISDTYDKFGRQVPIWSINHNFDNEIIESLENKFGDLEAKDNLAEAIVSASYNSVEDNLQDYLTEILENKDNTFLEELDNDTISFYTRKILSNSVAYMTLKRCGYNPKEYFDWQDFQEIVNFNTIGIIARIGNPTRDIAENCIREIYQTNYELEKDEQTRKNKIHTFDKNENKVYYKNNNEIDTNKNIEGGKINGESSDNLSQGGRLSDTRLDNQERETSDIEQIRNNENELSKETQEGTLYRVNDQWNIDGASTGNRETSSKEIRTDSNEPSRTESSKREDETRKSNAMGWIDEQLQESSRGDNLSRDNLQLNLFTDNKSEDEQKQIIEKAEVLENDTPAFFVPENGEIDNSNFEFTEEMITGALKEGSHFEEEKFRNEENQNKETISKINKSLEERLLDFETEYDIFDTDDEDIEYKENPRTIADIEKGLSTTENLKNYIDYYNQILESEDDENTKINQKLKGFISEMNNLLSEKEKMLKTENKDNENDLKVDILKENFKITDNHLGEGTPIEKYQNNLNAIKLLHTLEDENRNATYDEQETLSKYVGWGGLVDYFDENKHPTEFNELKKLLTNEEYKNARASSLTAFYTPPIVIKAIYQALENIGVQNANILEPSCGTGNFFGMIPDNLNNSKLYGVELDSITGRIAKKLYPNANIKVQGYEKSDFPDSFFDVAIGNVPFGDFKVNDKRYDKNNFLIHDYFFAKTLDKVRPGGIIAFITSKGTMDKANPNVRKYIAQRADLLGAIRLPDNTFTKNAGTKVTSDIIFLQKRENITDIMPDWVYLDKDENNITMNKYFVDNPEMILGTMQMTSTRFGYDTTCKADENQNLEDSLNYAITNIHGKIQDYQVENDLEKQEVDTSIPADPSVKNFSYTLIDNQIYYRENSRMYLQDLPLTNKNRIIGMIKIRDQVRELIDLQLNGYSDEEIKSSQARLNELYDNFSNVYGLINSRANQTAFSNDSSYFLLCSLEKLDGDGKYIGKADIFSKRTIKPNIEITHTDTSNEALILSLSEKAKVDLDYMSKLTNKRKDEIIEDLQGVIFKIPFSEEYQTADEYLSGNVREKYKIVKELSKTNPEFQINERALKEVIPKDIEASDIGIKLGTTWIPPKIVEQFMFELLDTSYYKRYNINVRYSEITNEWNIKNKNSDTSNIMAYSTYGTDRINAYKIIEQTLNLKDVKIFDTIIDCEGNKTKVLNKKETAIAQSKQDLIKEEFLNWVWNDTDRRNELVRIYNDRFNSIVPREFDGSHLNFVGMNPEIHLRKHQLNAIAHILYGKNVLLAHEVGAGKTYEMVAAAMESKRLGLCNKPLIVVPNHIIEQFASEFLQLYPSANILVSTKKDFETKNRKKFCSRIATGDFDAVIIGHSQFEKIPVSIERQRAILQQQIDDIVAGIREAKEQNSERFTIKQMEKLKKTLETRLEKLNKQDRKDDVITFEEMGVDKLFIDEAHNYKNLFLYTKMRNVGGIAQTESQKSSDLFMKCRYLDEITGGKGTVFATGTPVSNSMVELYTMQRYLQYDELVNLKMEHFDNWASTFGESVTALELNPESTGFRTKTRFAQFHNLPELMNIFKEVADIQTADTLHLPTPAVENHYVATKPSEIQKDMVKGLGERADKIRNREVDSQTDNMLKITNEGRKLALDQRLMNPILEDDENSKVNTCAENIFKIWNDTKDKKSTQLVFCDLSTPKVLNQDWLSPDYKFTDVYNDLKRKLMLKGIPESEIKFIHEADNEVKKKELFSKVRNGEVRILIGSTFKMGAGTNVQDKLIALHHLDCPWRPSDESHILRTSNCKTLKRLYLLGNVA